MRLVVVRRDFLLRAALAVTMATVLVGCGGSDSESASGGDSLESGSAPGGDLPLRARFVERSTLADGSEWKVHGAFDWEAMHGFFSEQDIFDLKVDGTRDIIQIGSRCYERQDGGRWQTSSPDEFDNMLCDPRFQDPRSEVELLRAVSSEWNEIGTTMEVQGIETTSYEAHVQVGAINERVELWIDDTGLPRKIIHEDETGDPDRRTRVVVEYFDFGRPVEVTAPTG